VHIIGNQYFNGVKSKTIDTMHDLRPMYESTLKLAYEMFEDDTDHLGNFRFYPRACKMNDLEVIALAVCSESAGIDSENLLFSKLKTDYRLSFPNLVDRSRFNRRRRGLGEYIQELTKRLAITMGVDSNIDLVDSVPCPIVKNSRERSFKICKEDPDNQPKKGWSAVDQRYYIGYKLHLLTSEYGVIQDMQLTPANVHDINFLKKLDPESYSLGKTILGDKGYISARLQVDLFTQYEINLQVPYKSNQENTSEMNPENGKKRRRIETQFSQLCDQFRLKHNYAKSFSGFFTRVLSKLAAIAVLQRVNIQKGRPLNHIKHAWS
jgi:IS5 family transposase